MIIKSKYLFAIVVLMYGSLTSAQEFKVRASLDTVLVTGFYKIPVTPELSSWSNGDLSDVRIESDARVFIPYINQKESIKDPLKNFSRFPVLSNVSQGRFTTTILENTLQAGISYLSLIITNTAVKRFIALSGSDDRSKWYVIDDSLYLYSSYRDTAGNYVQSIYFPPSKYKYFKIKINNANSDPIRIVEAGVYLNGDKAESNGFAYNPEPTFTQNDSSNNISYVVIKNNAAYLTDNIWLKIAGPEFYHRTATAYIMHSEKDSGSLNDPVASFTISSDKPCCFRINNQKVFAILLAIENKDNPPVKITEIATDQQMQYLISWLDKGKSYILLTGNPNATTPDYDLSHFKDKIPASVPTLTYNVISTTPKVETQAAKPATNNWLWPTIIISVLILSLLTLRLMKDMKHTKD